jgi:hypothetical protein
MVRSLGGWSAVLNLRRSDRVILSDDIDSGNRVFCGKNIGRVGGKNPVSICIPGSRKAKGRNNKIEMPGGSCQPGGAKTRRPPRTLELGTIGISPAINA